MFGFIFIIVALIIVGMFMQAYDEVKEEENFGKDEYCAKHKPKSKIKASDEDIIVFDTETTGFNAYGDDDILQLAIINGTGKTLYNSLFYPEHKDEWAEAERINHISPEMVEDAPFFSEEKDKIQAIFDKAKGMVGYNLEFDLKFLDANGINTKGKRRYDVMKEFASIYGEWDSYHQNFTFQKLTTCANYYGYQWDMSAHDALADCKATLHCYKSM